MDKPAIRAPTAAEMKALGHPTRLRILRLCYEQPLTNQELADRLGIAPPTALRHVRILTGTGFLAAQPVRTGEHGALERPYATTGLSVRLAWDAAEWPELLQQVGIAALHAFRAEMIEAGPAAYRDELRWTLRLGPDSRQELIDKIHALITEASERDEPGGETLNILWMMHAVPELRPLYPPQAVRGRPPLDDEHRGLVVEMGVHDLGDVGLEAIAVRTLRVRGVPDGLS
jgi:DNA-binding transcriptional ArsR family regulator